MWEGLTKEKVWTLFWIQSTGMCVCVFWRGNGQDPSDLNKVLREFQSHLPLNSEKLDKSTMEERARRKRPRDLLGVVV